MEYYLKFFEQGGTARELRAETHSPSQTASLMKEFVQREWIAKRGGRWFLTDAGERAWMRYLGVKC